jgi:hypothetical protein
LHAHRSGEMSRKAHKGRHPFGELKAQPRHRGDGTLAEKDAALARIGPGAVRVRYAGVQISSGGFPFMTTFDLPDAEYAKGRAAFVQMKEGALRKADEIKRDHMEKWGEVVGKS